MQRLIKLLCASIFAQLSKILFTLFYKGLIVPLIPLTVQVRLKKILITFILVGSQNFKMHELIFSNSLIVLCLSK